MPVTVNGKHGIDLGRIILRVERMGEDRDDIRKILDDIGKRMAGEARQVAKRKDVVGTSNLVNTIKHRIANASSKMTVTVFSGLKYSAVQELGGMRTPASRRAMFAELRRRGHLGRRGGKFPGARHEARPFMKPAFDRHAHETIGMIRDLLRRHD